MVKPEGKRVGTQTMEKLEEKAKELKCNKISFHVFAHNNPAIFLYKKMGYKITNLMMSKEI
jgi:ribosomal protein S18 acetylase RimI-like enzyme